MKILLVGNGTRQNRGCEAITITTLHLLREVYPYADIEILSFNPELDRYFESEFQVPVAPLLVQNRPIPNFFTRALRKLRLLPTESVAKYSTLSPYINTLVASDLVLSLGGDNYSDDYGVGGANLFWDLARWARRYKKPFVIWGASVGPFNTAETLSAAKSALKCVDMVTAREDETVAYLRTIGYRGELLRVCDSAFALSPRPTDLPVFPRVAPLIGFNISPIYHRYTTKTADEILAISLQVVERLSETYNVLLVPHVMCGADNNDALYMAQLITNADRVKLADPENDSRQLKYLISNCRIFVGARTHATIAAFSSCVPTLSLGYSMKARGLNRDIFGHIKFLLEANDFSEEAVMGKIHEIEANYDVIKDNLQLKKREINKDLGRQVRLAIEEYLL